MVTSASASFMQMQVSTREMKSRALAAVRAAVQKNRGGPLSHHPQLDLIEMALNGNQQQIYHINMKSTNPFDNMNSSEALEKATWGASDLLLKDILVCYMLLGLVAPECQAPS